MALDFIICIEYLLLEVLNRPKRFSKRLHEYFRYHDLKPTLWFSCYAIFTEDSAHISIRINKRQISNKQADVLGQHEHRIKKSKISNGLYSFGS